MTEQEWVEGFLWPGLRDALPECTVQPEQKLPYAHEIRSYSRSGSEGVDPSPNVRIKSYAIDLLIGERKGATLWHPRVAIEVKLWISTHGAITYSQKAATTRRYRRSSLRGLTPSPQGRTYTPHMANRPEFFRWVAARHAYDPHMSAKHLARYVGEFAGRRNLRAADTTDQIEASASGARA